MRTSEKIHDASTEWATLKTRHWILIGVFLTLLAVMAVAFFAGSLKSVIEQEVTVGGGKGGGPRKTIVGAEAVRIGCSGMTLGLLFGVWFVGLIANLSPLANRPKPKWLVRCYFGFGLLLLVAAGAIAFPPWRMSGVAFWASASILLVPMIARSRNIFRPMFLAMIVVALVVSIVARDIGGAIASAIPASLGGYVHAWMMVSGRIRNDSANTDEAGRNHGEGAG